MRSSDANRVLASGLVSAVWDTYSSTPWFGMPWRTKPDPQAFQRLDLRPPVRRERRPDTHRPREAFRRGYMRTCRPSCTTGIRT